MASRTEIEKKIEKSRDNLNTSINEIGNILHKTLNVKKQIKKNPTKLILGASIAGLAILTLSSKTGRKMIKSSINPLMTIGTAYLSKKLLRIINKD